MAKTEVPKSFPKDVAFRHTWRPYQARVLAELDAHLDDNHFHIVAAPGSGKTVLGLEVLLRLAKPALVFAPTVAIRDQWIRRFLDSFWGEAQRPAWLSTEPSAPGLLTIATYQSLTRFEKNQEIDELVKALEAAGVRTLVFDEAHHLRNQWWKTLDRVKAGLNSPFIIALTATPPYDVTQVEWNRYASICGEVDEEISAPELVKANNLCPHQDLVYFSEPTAQERLELEKFERGIAALLSDVALNEAFIQALQRHPVLETPADHIDELLADSDYYLSIAVFLKHASGIAPESLIKVLGLEDVTLPQFNHGWAGVLFRGVLFSDRDSFKEHDVLKQLHRELTARGAIERRTILLRSSPHNNRLLRSSISKLQSVADIVELESRTMDWRLRMVVLTDFIRDEDPPGADRVAQRFEKIGVVPIFDHVRKLRLPSVRLGVLTGRLVIVPTAARTALEFAAQAPGTSATAVSTHPLSHDPAYMRLEFTGEDGAGLELITRLFSEGHINVLIGTAALLGEGWDAPAVNSLVMATVIGSYVSSNQIRGRAIRVDPQDSFKTANIWHLACVDSARRLEEAGEDIDARDLERETDDWTLLERRFRAFAGLGHGTQTIESGIERLGIGAPESGAGIAELNARMCLEACKRDHMAEAWQNALVNPSITHSRVVHEIFVPATRVPSHPVMRHWLRGHGGWLARLRGWWLERRVLRIAHALLDSLQRENLIEAKPREVSVSTATQAIRVRLVGVSCREESLFVEALREIFDPLQTPRYLLVTRDEEFAVPRTLAERKEPADFFARCWRRRVGDARLMYVHTAEGKRRLLRAKERYLASKHFARTKSRLRWS